MDYGSSAALIIFMCMMVLCIVALRKRAEFILNFLLRGMVGVISIYVINEVLAAQSLSVTVGINPWTALTSGILGLPGVALLYGINLLKFL